MVMITSDSSPIASVSRLRRLIGDVDPLLRHDVNDGGIQLLTRCRAGGVHDHVLTSDLAREAGRHLGPPRVMHAEEQDLGLLVRRHGCHYAFLRLEFMQVLARRAGYSVDDREEAHGTTEQFRHDEPGYRSRRDAGEACSRTSSRRRLRGWRNSSNW